jgi:uncharacterized Ntn-hydrolase superfamily protein
MKFDILDSIREIRQNPQPQLVIDQLQQTRKDITALGFDISTMSDDVIIATNVKGCGMLEYFVDQRVDISQFSLSELGQLIILFLQCKETFAQQQAQNASNSLTNMLGEEGAQELTQFFQERGKVLRQI